MLGLHGEYACFSFSVWSTLEQMVVAQGKFRNKINLSQKNLSCIFPRVHSRIVGRAGTGVSITSKTWSVLFKSFSHSKPEFPLIK